MDLYKTLGVNKDASDEDIKKAYLKLVMEVHPDRCPGDEGAVEKFKEVQSAYDVLSDPLKRADYNRFGGSRPSASPFGGAPFSNIWEEFFGGGKDRGRNIQVRVNISLEEAAFGVKKTVTFHTRGSCEKCSGRGYTEWEACSTCSGSGKAFLKQSPFNIFMTCQPCHGTGRSGIVKCVDCVGTGFTPRGERTLEVDIPAGADTGIQIRIAGEGEPGRNGSKSGDAFVIIVVDKHDIFTRHGMDLIIEVPVTYTELVLGSSVTIPTLGKENIDIQIPAGSHVNTKFRIKGHGMPGLHGKGRGDLMALAKLEVPIELDEEYKEVLIRLSRIEKKRKD